MQIKCDRLVEQEQHLMHLKGIFAPIREKEAYLATEHMDIASKVELRFYGKGTEAKMEDAGKFKLRFHTPETESSSLQGNNMSLTFAQTSALAGDYFADPENPITNEGETELWNLTDERRARFMNAYYTLANPVLVEGTAHWNPEQFYKTLNTYLKFIQKERKNIEVRVDEYTDY